LYILDLSDYKDLKTSGFVDIKLVKYVGLTRILVSPDRNFKSDKIIEGLITQSISQITISPKTRNALGYNTHFYIAVSGDD
jgi:hypothetical protein